jgi:hypothetical protein
MLWMGKKKANIGSQLSSDRLRSRDGRGSCKTLVRLHTLREFCQFPRSAGRGAWRPKDHSASALVAEQTTDQQHSRSVAARLYGSAMQKGIPEHPVEGFILGLTMGSKALSV